MHNQERYISKQYTRSDIIYELLAYRVDEIVDNTVACEHLLSQGFSGFNNMTDEELLVWYYDICAIDTYCNLCILYNSENETCARGKDTETSWKLKCFRQQEPEIIGYQVEAGGEYIYDGDHAALPYIPSFCVFSYSDARRLQEYARSFGYSNARLIQYREGDIEAPQVGNPANYVGGGIELWPTI